MLEELFSLTQDLVWHWIVIFVLVLICRKLLLLAKKEDGAYLKEKAGNRPD